MRSEEAACTQCPLFEGATRQLLHGDGPTNARIMLVGEAPGLRENETGVPFVGDTGQLLNRLLAKAGLNRSDVFVTNTVRCRPPQNRTPSAKEINACKNHLLREIEEVQPALIIALGNPALKALTGLSGITKYRGQTFELHKSLRNGSATHPIVFPTFHPALALRYPENEQTILLDLITAQRQLDGGFREVATPWCFYRTGHVPDFCLGIASFDIETNARELHDPELKVWFGSIDDGAHIIVYVGEEEIPAYVSALQQCIDLGACLVGHNASAFDRAVLLEKYGVNIKCDDTQLLAHLIDEQQSLKLQNLAVKYLGVQPWKDDFTVDFWRRGPQTEDEWKRAFEYNARDSRYTRMLFPELWNRATDAERNLYRRHNLPCSRALRTTERHGVFLSVPNIEKAIAEIEVDQRMAEVKIKQATNAEFNPGSHQQVRELLFSDMMLPVQKKTKGQDASTDEETLKRLQAMGLGGELLKTILDYRENSKLLGTYLRPFLKFAPTMYPSYSMTTTVTGRTSSYGNKGPDGEPTATNLQNTPRDPRVRSCVAAPEGYAFLEADYSQLELRIAAELAGPQSVLFQEYLKPDADVHLTMAQWLTGKARGAITKNERSDAKPPNFAFLFFGDWKTYQRQALTDYDRVIGEDEARRAEAAFRQWGVQPWWDRIEAELRATGEVTSIFGRTRRLPSYRSRDKYAKLEALREAINFSDQSAASDLTLLAHACLVGEGWWTCGYIHDSVQMLVANDPLSISTAANAAKRAFEVEAPSIVEQIFGHRFQIPLVAEVKIGPHWGA